MDKEEGMTALYTTFVGIGERPAKGQEVFQMRGKGNELKDFNRIMTAVKGWQNAFAPQIEFEHFANRVSKLKSKDMHSYMY